MHPVATTMTLAILIITRKAKNVMHCNVKAARHRASHFRQFWGKLVYCACAEATIGWHASSSAEIWEINFFDHYVKSHRFDAWQTECSHR